MDEKKLIEQKIFNNTDDYQDIMAIPYHHSKRHLPMNQLDRAFQFAPFGALEGFSDLIQQKTKDYARKKYLNSTEEDKIKRQLEYLTNHPRKVDISYFNDESGYYEHLKGYLQKLDWKKGRAEFEDTSIVILNIRLIQLLNNNDSPKKGS
ncbi:hypothetical protein LCR01_12400 [Companilactobacillus crustorum]|uniref:Uncharacterized protein n=3 Tax=Companilactobacillus TaxID=2767879 RepID=A0A837RI17_9LACO|nr:hypothetical protein [Companilactobacillus crustorum]HCD07754.1 hypothetical protein [Lactobacillus sp.]APU72111.1 hypothetical protein BI355_1812 [Companilactobacillus crustorum]KRK42255.1 hypothetical protein FD26_GL000788 [Companilactobacillus crustorum JCM 15951]KRO20217.1 hypothetical protein IV63_GL000926 [Companilactobacillus crustorum]WDT65822.1 hypothetical protein NV391_00865 [Companilactobacillus crustorum]